MDKIGSKIVPTMFARFKEWVNEEMFLSICNGKEILCHKDYWYEI